MPEQPCRLPLKSFTAAGPPRWAVSLNARLHLGGPLLTTLYVRRPPDLAACFVLPCAHQQIARRAAHQRPAGGSTSLPAHTACTRLRTSRAKRSPAGCECARTPMHVYGPPHCLKHLLNKQVRAYVLQVCRLRSILSAWRDTAASASAAVARLKASWVARRRAALLLRALAGWRGECCAARVRSARALARAHAVVLRRALYHWHAAAAHARQRRRLAALCKHQASARSLAEHNDLTLLAPANPCCRN